jgi:hypothetical protein
MRNRNFWGSASWVSVFLMTILSGVVFGWFSQRWGPPEGINTVSSKLGELPDTIGSWELEEAREVSEGVFNVLRCSGFLDRVYVNRDTGERVEVYLIVGPAGPVSVHQPEICFKNHSHKQRGEREKVQIEERQLTDHLWALTFDPAEGNIDGQITRVYYAWTDGLEWQAPRDARFAFAGRPYIYKLQVSASLPVSASLEERDPCRAFLDELLPIARPHLCPAQQRSILSWNST